ncbi:hypothetical protein, partial [Escherichia coli]|uniref:hypothetical protein n=1 Tax=Escherichia coli TaxID=562 RepID=UPI001BC89BDF
SLKTSIKTITYLSDIGCLEIQGASLHGWCNMFEKIGVYGVVLTAHVVLNGAKKTYTLKMWVIILKESHI